MTSAFASPRVGRSAAGGLALDQPGGPLEVERVAHVVEAVGDDRAGDAQRRGPVGVAGFGREAVMARTNLRAARNEVKGR